MAAMIAMTYSNGSEQQNCLSEIGAPFLRATECGHPLSTYNPR